MMTIKELKEILERYPDDALITYRHNEYGRMDVDEIDYKEEMLFSGKKIRLFTLEASFEED